MGKVKSIAIFLVPLLGICFGKWCPYSKGELVTFTWEQEDGVRVERTGFITDSTQKWKSNVPNEYEVHVPGPKGIPGTGKTYGKITEDKIRSALKTDDIMSAYIHMGNQGQIVKVLFEEPTQKEENKEETEKNKEYRVRKLGGSTESESIVVERKNLRVPGNYLKLLCEAKESGVEIHRLQDLSGFKVERFEKYDLSQLIKDVQNNEKLRKYNRRIKELEEKKKKVAAERKSNYDDHLNALTKECKKLEDIKENLENVYKYERKKNLYPEQYYKKPELVEDTSPLVVADIDKPKKQTNGDPISASTHGEEAAAEFGDFKRGNIVEIRKNGFDDTSVIGKRGIIVACEKMNFYNHRRYQVRCKVENFEADYHWIQYSKSDSLVHSYKSGEAYWYRQNNGEKEPNWTPVYIKKDESNADTLAQDLRDPRRKSFKVENLNQLYATRDDPEWGRGADDLKAANDVYAKMKIPKLTEDNLTNLFDEYRRKKQQQEAGTKTKLNVAELKKKEEEEIEALEREEAGKNSTNTIMSLGGLILAVMLFSSISQGCVNNLAQMSEGKGGIIGGDEKSVSWCIAPITIVSLIALSCGALAVLQKTGNVDVPYLRDNIPFLQRSVPEAVEDTEDDSNSPEAEAPKRPSGLNRLQLLKAAAKNVPKNVTAQPEPKKGLPTWVYFAIGGVLLTLLLLVVTNNMLFGSKETRNRNSRYED